MCGIVGCFIKDDVLRPKLGEMLSNMLIIMTDRGPDSAGFAVYGDEKEARLKITVQSSEPDRDFPMLKQNLYQSANVQRKSSHAVLDVAEGDAQSVLDNLAKHHVHTRVMGVGRSMEIYKEVGRPIDVCRRFGLSHMSGSHGVGHTRMATESAVTTLGAHPFSTGEDQCLVHNGSLSNHNNLRRALRKKGRHISTENDSEVAANYLSYRLEDCSLRDALEGMLDDVDGFYTFVVGTHKGFGVLRDKIACKPAVMAETDGYVAFASEYRALAVLPNIENARVWEPEPATVYFWEKS